ncbi:MAG: hypothetical protein ACRD59_02805 [Candidatus Acidiferrales bacterium]
MTGTTLQQPQAFGPPKSTKVSSEPMALIAVLCSCAVLGLALCKGRSILIAGIVAACAAVFFLFALKVHMESEVAQNSGIQLQWQIGFWLATILNLAAGAIQLFTMIQKPVASSG